MRTGFVTCVQLGVDVLEEILKVGGSVDAIVTLNDDIATEKSGRAQLDSMASRHNAALHKTSNINDSLTIRWIEELGLDWLFIIGWSQIAGEQILSIPRYGCLGMHPTLLPEGRGRASVPWAILKGLDKTGVTLFKLDNGVDTGPILDQVEILVDPEETASTLYMKVLLAHRQLIRGNWTAITQGAIAYSQQDETRATIWPGRRPEDGRILRRMTVAQVDTLVRAVTAPYPGARWTDEHGYDWVIWSGRPQSASEPGLEVPLHDGVYVARVFERA